ncbi:MAG TPA: phage tail protein [Roseiarcus sp.]|jgi:hypothetical protein|nr:phage tail protein [Roseiarcus sp.]
MGFLRRNSNQIKPDYTGLQINTAVSTLPIPIVWGRNKLAGNVIWYNRFVAVPSYGGGKGSGGKGGVLGGRGSPVGYTYQADLMIALCEGPISNIPTVWQDLSVYYTPLALDLNTYDGTTPQSVWPWLTAYYPGQDLAYQGTAFVCGASFNLGDTASIGNLNFEVLGALAGTGANGIDADPAQVIYDFLTNAQYGAGFDPASIDSSTLFGSGGDASLQTYCKAMGIAFSPLLSAQEQGSSIMTRWLQILSCAGVWSGGLLRFIPYGDSAIASGATTTLTQQFSIPHPVPTSTGYQLPASVTVAGAASFLSDGGVVYASTGVPFAFIGAEFPSVAGTYGMGPNGTYLFAYADEGLPVVITYTVAAPTAYAPKLTPAYALTDDNFIDAKANKDPVQVERADVFALPTIQRVEVSSRSNRYSPVPVEARDQSQIEIFGPRVGSVIQAHEICDEFTIGPIVAQTILQRELYVRTKFKFILSWEFCLLDPMDIVTITDANLGLSNYPVRIIEIDEDDKGLLAITAEELVFGVSTPGVNPGAGAGNWNPDWGVPAVPVNAPLIYEPPSAATGGVTQVWIGASGISAGSSTQWGGANVYVSVDNVTYSQIFQVTAPLRQGVLTASLPAASGWDSADTLSVNLAESAGTLSGTSQAAAEQGATLSLVDSELLAYENATLVSGNAYNLTGLARALGGTSGLSHASGAPFARLDGAIVKYDLPANLVGVTLYFKFQSFNVFGGGEQDLSTCVAYSFTPSGVGVEHPIAAQLETGVPVDLGSVASPQVLRDDFGADGSTVLAIIDLGALPTAHPIAAQLLTGWALNLGAAASTPSLFDNFGATTDAVGDVIALGTVP